MHDRNTRSIISGHGVTLMFMNGPHVAQYDHVFTHNADFNVLRAMTNWKMYGQLPKRVIH